MDIPQPFYGRLNMPIQQIELEEVTMVEVSDIELEKSIGLAFTTTTACFTNSYCGTNGAG